MQKVLIVDDNSNNLYMLKVILEGSGLEVIAAENGQEALEKARLHPPDLVVSDILMPVIDGYALCRAWKSEDTLKQIPFFFYTATYTEAKDEAFALSLGAERFIVKPQDPAVLIRSMKEVLAKNHVSNPAAASPLGEEMEFFRQHNAFLFKKLEKKMQDLETANQELRTLEEKYRLSFENVSDVICMLDADLTVLSMSPSVERLSGYKPDHFVGRSVASLSHVFTPESFERASVNLSMFFKGETVPTTIYELVARDGAIKHLEINGSPFMREGRIAGIVCVVRDITRRRKSEENLRYWMQRYELIVASSGQVAYEYMVSTHQITWGSSMEKVLGYSMQEISGGFLQWQKLLHPEDREATLAALATAEKDCAYWDSRYRLLHKRGEYVWIRDRGFFLPDACQLGMLEDITEYQRAEEEKRNLEERLQRAQKMEALGQLAGGVAHDLNNVLGVLSGYSELLLMEIPEGQKARGHSEKILQSTKKGAAIIQDLLTLARRGVAASEVVNLNQIVSDYLSSPTYEHIRDNHPGVTFRTECQDELLNVKGSPVHLEKTLMNLVCNAVESIPQEGSVTIRTENRHLDKAIRGYDEVREGDYVVLTVSDTGAGIPDQHQEKIFEPFYTRKVMGRSGTGLGLAIVWGTVKDHNGYIDLQTEAGKGATFSLYFPVTREELTAPRQKTPIQQYLGKGEAVLVVDDIAEQRDIASGLLKKLGYKVQAVSSGEAAVEYLKANKADILVLDMIMDPGIDGLETYRRVLEIHPRQKAILVSGFSETDRVRKAQQLGAGAYVKKPYVMEKIGVAIRRELKR
jgi:PAS domain S-box-containing protein